MININNYYDTVIGLEVHIELSTKSKIFCSCKNSFAERENENTCPVCLGMPGALPVLNKAVLDSSIKLAAATSSKVSNYIKFDRKNYFYPDNPQGYQISQFYLPFAKEGFIDLDKYNKRIRIKEMHMEDDAGKLYHDKYSDRTRVDFNRSGIPLIEVVTEPDFRNSDEVLSFLEELRDIVRYLNISDAKIQEGSMRVDINLSVKEKESSEYGTRVELKNLGSFCEIKRAILSESMRQISLLENNEDIECETRRWDERNSLSHAIRKKESCFDYRYFREPNIPTIFISDEDIKRIRESINELRRDKIERYIREYSLDRAAAHTLTERLSIARLFESTIDICKNKYSDIWFGDNAEMIKYIINLLSNELSSIANKNNIDLENVIFSTEYLAKLIELIHNNRVNYMNAKLAFENMILYDKEPEAFIKDNNLYIIRDRDIIFKEIKAVLEENIDVVSDYRSGKKKVFGYILGLVMKRMKNLADPTIVNEIAKKILEE